VRYKQREGNCNVPSRHTEDGHNLGQWLKTQRQFKKKGTLDAAKEQKLDELGVVWNMLSQQWENMYTLLVKYKKREGYCDVPLYHTENGKNLGTWLNTQRQYKKKGNLDAAKGQKLEAIGIVWLPLNRQWENMYTVLLQYEQREGHCNVPHNHIEDGKKLGEWLTNQRKEKKKGKLDAAKEQKLEKLSVVWEPLFRQWETKYTLLLQYEQREGHCNVPFGHKEDGQTLGIWLNTQRYSNRTGRLGVFRFRKLEDIGIVWNLR